jgi:hypothetical protein
VKIVGDCVAGRLDKREEAADPDVSGEEVGDAEGYREVANGKGDGLLGGHDVSPFRVVFMAAVCATIFY